MEEKQNLSKTAPKKLTFLEVKERYENAYEALNGFKPHSITQNKGWIRVCIKDYSADIKFRLSELLTASHQLEARKNNPILAKKSNDPTTHRMSGGLSEK